MFVLNMTLPEFTRSNRFLDQFDLPCLWVKVKNSQLPGIASRHVIESEEDPDCDIYLRGRKAEKISPWQQEILERLFNSEGLAAAVTEAMNEYETSPKWGGNNYAELAEEARQKIRQYGIAAYITVSAIVIDEITRKVIFRADTIIDGNLDEHGITIFLSKERWRFDTADYFIRYEANVADSEELWTWETAEKKWDTLYPPGEPGETGETAAGPLLGTWDLNVPESKALLKRLGAPTVKIDHVIGNWEGTGLAISREVLRDFAWNGPRPFEGRFRVLRCAQRGNRFTLQLRYEQRTRSGYGGGGNAVNEVKALVGLLGAEAGKDKPDPHTLNTLETSEDKIETMNFWCDGRILVRDNGLLYHPTARPAPEGPYQSPVDCLKNLLGGVFGSK
jgi:hypothetical protein